MLKFTLCTLCANKLNVRYYLVESKWEEPVHEPEEIKWNIIRLCDIKSKGIDTLLTANK